MDGRRPKPKTPLRRKTGARILKVGRRLSGDAQERIERHAISKRYLKEAYTDAQRVTAGLAGKIRMLRILPKNDPHAEKLRAELGSANAFRYLGWQGKPYAEEIGEKLGLAEEKTNQYKRKANLIRKPAHKLARFIGGKRKRTK